MISKLHIFIKINKRSLLRVPELDILTTFVDKLLSNVGKSISA